MTPSDILLTLAVQVRRLSPLAILPRYMSDLAAGVDLHAVLDAGITLAPGGAHSCADRSGTGDPCRL